MPRLSSAGCYQAHKELRYFWLHNIRLYAELSSADQYLLHDYFQPRQDLTKDQLLAD